MEFYHLGLSLDGLFESTNFDIIYRLFSLLRIIDGRYRGTKF